MAIVDDELFQKLVTLMEEGGELLTEDIAAEIAKARFGPGVDMGGRHHPRPTEMKTAKRLVEDYWVPMEMLVLALTQGLKKSE